MQSKISDDSYLAHGSEFGDPNLPLRRLSLAMVERAIKDIVTGTEPQRRDALGWVKEDERGQFTFADCCHFLSMEPEYLRTAIKEFTFNALKTERKPKESIFTYRRRSVQQEGSAAYVPARLARYTVRVP